MVSKFIRIFILFLTFPILIPILIISKLLPKRLARYYLKTFSFLLESVNLLFLVPGLLRSNHRELILKVDKNNSSIEELILIFGGNDSSPQEALELFEGMEMAWIDPSLTPLIMGTKKYIAVFPLYYAHDEYEYLNIIEKRARKIISDLPNIKYITLCGHSLGGALAIGLINRLMPDYSFQFALAVSRTFSTLWNVAPHRYPKSVAAILEFFFNPLFNFDNVKALKDLAQHKPIPVKIHQLDPDEVIPLKAQLLTAIAKDLESFPPYWLIEFDTLTGQIYDDPQGWEPHIMTIRRLNTLLKKNYMTTVRKSFGQFHVNNNQ